MNFRRLFFMVSFAGALFAFPACTSLQTALSSPTATAIEAAVVPLVAQYAATGKVNEAQAISVGLQSISTLAASQGSNAELQALIASTVAAFTGDQGTAGQSVGQKIATVLVGALPVNASPQAVTQAVVAAGVAASSGANGAGK